jgi:hypothetical protein
MDASRIPSIGDITERRDAASQHERDIALSTAEAIDRHYLHELELQHAAVMIGIVVDATTAIEAGSSVASSKCNAHLKLQDQYNVLQESVKIRLDARDGMVCYDGGLASLLQIVETHHRKALKIVSFMLARIESIHSATEVKADALSMLQSKEEELMNVFSKKCQDAELLIQHGEGLAKLKVEEECFADIAVQAALANPESWTVCQVALQAITRAVRITSAMSGKAVPEDGLKEKWSLFALNSGTPGENTSVPEQIQRDVNLIMAWQV